MNEHDKHKVNDHEIDGIILRMDGLYENFIKNFKSETDTIHYLLTMRKYIDKYVTLLQAKSQGRKYFYFDDQKPVSQAQIDGWKGVGIYNVEFSEYDNISEKIINAKMLLRDYWKGEGYIIEFYGLDDEEDDFEDYELVTTDTDFYKWEDEFSEAAELLESNNILVYRIKVEDAIEVED